MTDLFMIEIIYHSPLTASDMKKIIDIQGKLALHCKGELNKRKTDVSMFIQLLFIIGKNACIVFDSTL